MLLAWTHALPLLGFVNRLGWGGGALHGCKSLPHLKLDYLGLAKVLWDFLRAGYANACGGDLFDDR